MNSLNNKKNLLVIASTYPRWLGDHEPGFVHELSKRLTAEFDVTVICPHAIDSTEIEQLDNVMVYRYRYAPDLLESLVGNGGIVTNLKNHPWKLLLLPSFFLMQIITINRILKRKNIDVIHAHWLIPQGLSLAILSKIKKIPPFLVTSHGADLFALKGYFFDFLKKLVIRQAEKSTVVSNVMKPELLSLGADDNKLSVIPMGVELQNFKIDQDVTRSKDELLFVGRLVEKKGLVDLINVLPEIIKYRPSTHLTVIGFGPEERKLKDLVKRLKLEEKVHFIGAMTQDSLIAYYQRAALFVAPFIEAKSGDQEGLGLVLVEAIACGCPVVVSSMPACHDVINNMEGIYLFDSGNAEALTHKLNEALNAAPLTIQVSNDNRAKLKQKFCWSQITNKYSHQLKQIVKKELH